MYIFKPFKANQKHSYGYLATYMHMQTKALMLMDYYKYVASLILNDTILYNITFGGGNFFVANSSEFPLHNVSLRAFINFLATCQFPRKTLICQKFLPPKIMLNLAI